MDYNEIGQNIKMYRLVKKLTQKQLGEKAGLTANYISLVERNKKILSVYDFVKIANALNVSVNMILNEKRVSNQLAYNIVLIEKINRLSEKEAYILDNLVDILF